MAGTQPASASATALDANAEVNSLIRREIDQLRIELGIRLDVRAEEIKRELVQAGDELVDKIRLETVRASSDVEQIRSDCITLQKQLLSHQGEMEAQIGRWQAHLQSLLIQFDAELRDKFAGINSDLIHQHQKVEGLIQQTRDALESTGTRVSQLEGQLLGKGAGAQE